MGTPALDIKRIHDENIVLRNILEGTATATGEHFFRALVENLAKTIQTHSAWVTEYVPAKRQLHALAFWSDGQVYENFFIDVDGTPCQKVIESTDIIHYPDNVLRLYPQNATFKEFRAKSYLGIPLLDNAGRVLGNLAVFDTRPMPREPQLLVVFRIFAARASAELQRSREIAEGHIIALGTDGIWETFDRNGRRYGMRRLRNVIRRIAHQGATAILDAVYTDVQRFAYGTKQEDDISLVIVKAVPDQAPPMDWSI